MTSDTILMLLTVMIAITGFYNGFLYLLAQLICLVLACMTNIYIVHHQKHLFTQNNLHTNILLLSLMSVIWIPLFWMIIRICIPKQLPIGIFFTNRIIGMLSNLLFFFSILLYADMTIPYVEQNFCKDSLIMQDARKYRPYIAQGMHYIKTTKIYQELMKNLRYK